MDMFKCLLEQSINHGSLPIIFDFILGSALSYSPLAECLSLHFFTASKLLHVRVPSNSSRLLVIP